MQFVVGICLLIDVCEIAPEVARVDFLELVFLEQGRGEFVIDSTLFDEEEAEVPSEWVKNI